MPQWNELFSSSRVLQVQNQVNFVNNDSKVVNLTTIGTRVDSHTMMTMADEIDELSRGGEYNGLDKYYGRGKSGRWSRGLADVVGYIDKAFDTENIPENVRDKIDAILENNYFFASEDRKTESIRIGRIDPLSWFLRVRDNLPSWVDDEIKYNPHYFVTEKNGKINLFNTTELKNYDEITFEAEIDGYYYYKDKDNNAFAEPRPKFEQYYVVNFIIEESISTLIIQYEEGLVSEFEQYKLNDFVENLTAFPVIPMVEDKNFKNVLLYDQFLDASGSNIGHTMYPDCLKFERIKEKKEEYDKELPARYMLSLLGLDYDSIFYGFVSSSKRIAYKVNEDKEEELNTKILEWNNNQDNKYDQVTKDSLEEYITDAMEAREEAKCFGYGDGEVIIGGLTKTQCEKYLKCFASDSQYFNLDINSEYIAFSGKVEFFINYFNSSASLTENVNNLKNINSLFISISLDLFSTHQVVLKSIFETFKLYYSHENEEEDIRYEYIEGRYNKQIGFKKIYKTESTIDLEEEDRSAFHKKEMVGSGLYYKISEYKRIGDSDQFNLIEYTIEDLFVYTIITENGMQKGAKVYAKDDDAEERMALPLLKSVYNQLFPVEKNQISLYAVTLEIYISNITSLHWYQKEIWVKIVKIAIIVAEIAYIIGSLGNGATTAQTIGKALEAYIINKIIDYAIAELIQHTTGDLQKILIAAYAGYRIYNLDYSEINFQSVLKITDAITSSIVQIQQLELQEIANEQDQAAKEHKEAMKELEEFRAAHGLDDDDAETYSIDEMPETPNSFYDRTLKLPVELPNSVEGWYYNKLKVEYT